MLGTQVSRAKMAELIGTDFRRAMVATAPGQKLLTGRRPVSNWTQLHWQSMIQMVTPYDIKLVLCRKLHLFVGKSTKSAAT